RLFCSFRYTAPPDTHTLRPALGSALAPRYSAPGHGRNLPGSACAGRMRDCCAPPRVVDWLSEQPQISLGHPGISSPSSVRLLPCTRLAHRAPSSSELLRPSLKCSAAAAERTSVRFLQKTRSTLLLRGNTPPARWSGE